MSPDAFPIIQCEVRIAGVPCSEVDRLNMITWYQLRASFVGAVVDGLGRLLREYVPSIAKIYLRNIGEKGLCSVFLYMKTWGRASCRVLLAFSSAMI